MFSFLFTDGSDLTGIIRSQDIKYIRILRVVLKILRAWPGKLLDETESKYSIYGKCYIFFIEFICLPPGLLYIKHSIGSIPFLELGHTYITVFMNVIAMLRLVLIFLNSYDKLVADFINKIHLFHHKDKSQYAMKIHLMVHKVSHFFTIYINTMMLIAILFFTCTPLYKNIASGTFNNYRSGNVTFEHSVYYYLPFDYKHNIKGYVIVFIFNWYIALICSSCFCTFDLLMYLIVFHVWGHLRILTDKLENFRRPTNKLNDNYKCYTEEEMILVARDLKEIVVHHNLIIEFKSRMTMIFGPVLALYYLFYTVTGCILLLECSQMDPAALTRYGAMTFLLFQLLIQISTVFELLGVSSDNLLNAVYNLPWEYMDNANRKTVYIILLQCQKLLNLKALNMVNVGVQTMASIIKTTFSYFIMLRTVAEVD